MSSTRVGAAGKTQFRSKAQRVTVHLPARRAVHGRRCAENLGVPFHYLVHLANRPFAVGPGNLILPIHVVPTVNAGLEAGGMNSPHHVARAPANVRPRQQRSVEQRFQPVVFDDRGALDLAEKAASEYPPDRPAGVVGTETEQEGRIRLMTLKQFDQARRTFQRSPQSINVNLEDQQGGGHPGSINESAGVSDVGAVGLENPPQGVIHRHFRLPVEISAGVFDLRHPLLHILIAWAVVVR